MLSLSSLIASSYSTSMAGEAIINEKELTPSSSVTAGRQKPEDVDMSVETKAAPVVYDPMQESIWTRLGLTFESVKRAPGSTG